MIQLNLLPDIKLEFLKAQRVKRLVILGAFMVTAGSIAIIIIMSFVVFVWDKKSINDLTGDIKKYSNDLGDVEALNKALTVQSQLSSLKTLHTQKPKLSRLKDILTVITPNDVSLTSLTLDSTNYTMTLSGQAASLERSNTMADTLKFAYYKLPNSNEKITPFTKVSVQSGFDGKVAGVKAVFTYDPVIFDPTKDIVVEVEKGKTTSRAEIEKPNPLFIKSTTEEEEQP